MGKAPLPDAALVIKDGRIAYAGPAAGVPLLPADTEKIDARGGTILPGIVEAHFHATYFNIAALEDLDIKYPVEYVSLLSSVNTRLATNGREICSAGGLMDWNPEFRKIGMEGLVFIINGVEDARKAVRALVKDGIEWVKTYPTGDAASPDINDHHTLCMTFDEMHAVVATAHNHKLKVTGHCRATQGIKNALRAGYDTIEHGTFIDDEGLDMLLERDVPCIPALFFEKMSIERGPEFGLSQRVIDGHQETLDGGAESARRILRAGGRLGMGGDYGFGWNPHGDYARELTFFVKDVGLTPLEVITCATKTGAEIMGRSEEFGTLEKGKLADVLIVDGDVIADIALLEDRKKFIAVMQGGVVKAGQLAKPFPTVVKREK